MSDVGAPDLELGSWEIWRKSWQSWHFQKLTTALSCCGPCLFRFFQVPSSTLAYTDMKEEAGDTAGSQSRLVQTSQLYFQVPALLAMVTTETMQVRDGWPESKNRRLTARPIKKKSWKKVTDHESYLTACVADFNHVQFLHRTGQDL